jgi:phosphohistidine phosphatase
VTAILVHHGDAVGPDVDPQRPLSVHGRDEIRDLASRAERAGLRPDVVWHSGKLRARQTAELYWRACNPFAAFAMVAGLRPEDDPVVATNALAAEDGVVMLVSHMPLLPALLFALTGSAGTFPLNGLVVLERLEAGGYAERTRMAP